jgi:hypothetical protein
VSVCAMLLEITFRRFICVDIPKPDVYRPLNI